jgi:hypothetical protein
MLSDYDCLSMGSRFRGNDEHKLTNKPPQIA